MRSLVAARRVNASLVRIAATVPQSNPFHRIFVALAKLASAQEDQFVRLSYLEGVLGYPPNSIVRKPALHLKEAREAITSGDYESNAIARKLVVDLEVPPAEALRFVSANDQQVWDGLIYASYNQMKPSGTVRGLSAQSIVNSIVFGISPITGNWMKYGPGKGMMYWLGEQAFKGITLAGVKSISKKEIANRTKDVVRGTPDEEKGMISLDQPAFEGDFSESPAAILETLTTGDDMFSEDLASSILRYDATLRIISPAVMEALRTPTQKAVWEIVRDNPSMLTIEQGRIGVEGRELAKMFASRTGQEYKGKSTDVVMAKVFKEYVLPEMFKAIKSDDAVRELIRSRDILQVMREEIARRPKDQGGGRFVQKTPSPTKSWKSIPKDDPRWQKMVEEEEARVQQQIQQKVPWAHFASSRGSLVRLASLMPKGSSERRTLLKFALDMSGELAKDADPASKDQNKPESYYGLPPKGIQASSRSR